VLPVCISTALGLKELLLTVTAADVGGAPAVAVKSCTGRPAAVALTVCDGAEPTLSTVLATPLEFVVL